MRHTGMLHSVNKGLVLKPNSARTATIVSATAAVSLSVLFHGALPFLGTLVRDKHATTSIQLIAAAPPKLLAEAEEEKEGPALDPEPEGEKADSKKNAKSGSKDPSEPASKPATAKPASALAKASLPPPQEIQPVRARSSKKAVRLQRSKIHERTRPLSRVERMRQMRAARAQKSKAKRSGEAGGKGNGKASSKGSEGKGGGEGGGSAHAAGGKKGDIEPVYVCTKDGLGQRVNVRMERPIDDWVTIMPTVLMPFDTRPGLGDYLGGVSQIVSRKRRGIKKAGPVEFALPASVLQMGLESPSGVRIALGHLGGRCLVGMKYSRQLFPIELMKVPARVMDNGGRTQTALVHIKLYKDASFDIIAEEGSLPFSSGRLGNADEIASNIQSHYSAARTFREVAGWFGYDVTKNARARRHARAKDRREQKADKARGGGSVARTR